MARLKSHGQEIFRFSQEKDTPENTATWSRTTTAIFADRAILKKLDVRFPPDNFDPKGRLHSYGWKLAGKVKEGAFRDYLLKLRDKARVMDGVKIEADCIDSFFGVVV